MKERMVGTNNDHILYRVYRFWSSAGSGDIIKYMIICS